MNSTNLIKVSAIVLGCIVAFMEVTGLWFNSFSLIITGLVIALLEFMIIETRKIMVETTDRLYELYMEENQTDTKDKDDEIKRLDELTKELRLELSTLKVRVDNLNIPTINVPYNMQTTPIPKDTKWEVYCNTHDLENAELSKVGKIDVQIAEIKSNIGDTLPTITTTTGSGELHIPPEYRDTEIPE